MPNPNPQPVPPRRRVFPPSEARIKRERLGVALSDAASKAGISMNRASVIERNPEEAKPGELEQLERAAAKVAREIRRILKTPPKRKARRRP